MQNFLGIDSGMLFLIILILILMNQFNINVYSMLKFILVIYFLYYINPSMFSSVKNLLGSYITDVSIAWNKPSDKKIVPIESDKKVEDFIKEKKLLNFFVNEIEDALVNYKPGVPSMKPDVLEQIKTLTASRNEIAKQGQLCHEVNGKQEILKPEEIVTILSQQDATIKIWDYETAQYERTLKGNNKKTNIITILHIT
jgi:WD40 repeat protein